MATKKQNKRLVRRKAARAAKLSDIKQVSSRRLVVHGYKSGANLKEVKGKDNAS